MAARHLAIIACLFCGCTREPARKLTRPRPVGGTLSVSGFADGMTDPRSDVTPHRLLLVPGSGYDGMKDNDIRGFPNGRWVHGWNQVGQRHLRLGRGSYTARFGEREIVRALQRWDDIPLPSNAVVTQVALEIVVETGIEDPADVMLFEVHRAWNPGLGGTQRDNTSPPAAGEVWWPAAAHGAVEWGLPGASFASNDPELGDIAPSALATTQYVPGTKTLTFSSRALTGYVQRRVASSEPLQFLLKLSDSDEDLASDQLVVYSAEEGDSLSASRRPKLSIAWHAPGEVVGWTSDVLLENGRSMEFPKLASQGATRWAVSFETAADYESPEIEIRGGDASSAAKWRSATPAFEADWDWVQVRLVAATNPVALGTSFESEFVDTWVPDTLPENEAVTWHFTDPLGRETERRGSYEGQFRWRVSFDPVVPGRWSYYFDHDLSWPPYRSERTVFDVVGGDLAVLLDHLDQLAARIEASDVSSRSAKFHAFGDELLRLERAAFQRLTPEALRSERGQELSRRIDEVRRELGEALPEQPTPFTREDRRSIKQDIRRTMYRAFDEPKDE